jgi:outer membrane protein W
MRLVAGSLAVAFVVLTTQAASAGPFGKGRSEGRPTPAKTKPAPRPTKTSKVTPSKPAPKPNKATKADDVDEDLIVIEDSDDDDGVPAPKKNDPFSKRNKATRAKAKASADDEEPIAKKSTKTKVVEDDEEDEDTEDTDEPRKDVAVADDEEQTDEPARVTKKAPIKSPRKTRFYFRAGAQHKSTKLGATQFQLITDLPVDTSGLGAGSGVEQEEKQIPVGGIIGVVLPVAQRKLSIETVLGIPTPTKFRATGKLATESLAPTFMGLPTGIEPLGSELGEVTFAPPVVTAVYRVVDLGPVTPIVGVGGMILLSRNGKITNPVLNEAGDPKLKIAPAPGLVLQSGLEIKLGRRFAARLDVKYVVGLKVKATIEDIAVTPKAIPTLGSIPVGDAVMLAKVAPLIIQGGVGVDF